MTENNLEQEPSRYPPVTVSILGGTENILPVTISAMGMENAMGAFGVAAALGESQQIPVVQESKRYDLHINERVAELDNIEGIPTELEPGNRYSTKGISDASSISSRMAQRPSRVKHSPEV